MRSNICTVLGLAAAGSVLACGSTAKLVEPSARSGAAIASPPTSASESGTETYFADEPVRLTSPEVFSRAGEAYFSPDATWIIFQAVPVGEESEPVRYAMFVAPLRRDARGTVIGIGRPVRLSAPGSANTCGWFHPALPGVVLYGSTIDEPAELGAADYSRAESRYSWEFPGEMEIVTQTVREIVEDRVRNPQLRRELLARPDVGSPTPMWTRAGYDAEGSWSPDGRLVLYTHVDPATDDADIFVFDVASGRSVPLVVAPGYDGGPFFSPDGKRICYRSDRRGDDLLQLFVADLSFDAHGTPTGIERETQLTDDGQVNWAPFWHPSGDWLVYASSRAGHHNYEVFAVPSRLNTAGSVPEPARITHAPGFDGLPVFSRDGSLMMWTGQRGGPGAAGERSSQLYVAPVRPGSPGGLRLGRPPASDDALGAPIADALADATPAERRYHEHVTILASDWLAGRFPGTDQIAVAESYIRDWFVRTGLEPAFVAADGRRSFFQPFPFALHGSNATIEARNVGGVLRGRGALADRWIVVGAHHDHLGRGEHGSMSGAGEIHEGADDNASGTAAVLAVAEILAERYTTLEPDADARSVLFVTFSAEELGLNGSRHLVRNPPVDLDRCDLMLNYDMIGRITGGRVSVSGLGSGAGLETILESAIEASPLRAVRPGGLSSRSDHASFYDAGVPVVFMTIDPFHTDYHTPADESWKLNSRGAVLASELGADVVHAVAVHPDPIAFQEVKAYDRGPSITMGGIKVRFGIMPGNYNDTEPGVLVQRVSPGGSADAGGVLAGDRLMAWDGEPITTVSRWMELMAENVPGQVVTVTVRRNGEEVHLRVPLQAARQRRSD